MNRSNSKVVPTVDILPHYFVGEDIIFNEALKKHQKLLKLGLYGVEVNHMQVMDTEKIVEESKSLENVMKKTKNNLKSISHHESSKSDFRLKELQYLNKKPKMPYLKPERGKSRITIRKNNYFKDKGRLVANIK